MGEYHVPCNFTIVTDEENETSQLIDVDTGEIILSGDYYHDHIDDRISGFLQCMDFFNYTYTCRPIE